MDKGNMSSCCDAFTILKNLEGAFNGLTSGEINLYAYLACLLSLYDEQLPSYWGYSFSYTESGSPYSDSLMKALDLIISRGDVIKEGRTYSTTQSGREFWIQFHELGEFVDRTKFINAACNSALALRPSIIKDAVHN